MPKDKTSNSSFKKHRASPYHCASKDSDNYRFKESELKPTEFEKEWENVRCPICMEHPHNAVLLSCSSCENGCRPYMCDTSYRHSNCLDQFIKSCTKESGTHVTCPLCRGEINGWSVVDPARKFMNLKDRSCSMETCSFNGNYSELRKHARVQHPSVKPSEVDPTRQNDWTTLVRHSDFNDAYHLPYLDFEDVFFNINDSEPEDEHVDNYNLFLDFELDFTFLDQFSEMDHVVGPGLF